MLAKINKYISVYVTFTNPHTQASTMHVDTILLQNIEHLLHYLVNGLAGAVGIETMFILIKESPTFNFPPVIF